MSKLPYDLTRRGLAETIARRARLSARRDSLPVDRDRVEQTMNQMQRWGSYSGISWPALRTVLAEVRRQAQITGEDVNLR